MSADVWSLWERRWEMCRNAVVRYRSSLALELCAADVDDVAASVLLDVARKIRTGQWRFVSSGMLEKRVINELRNESRRRAREDRILNVARRGARTAMLTELRRSRDFAYRAGMGTSADDSAHKILMQLPLRLPAAAGAVVSIGLSSGLNLRKSESHRWIGECLGYSEGTVRQYIGRARKVVMNWSRGSVVDIGVKEFLGFRKVLLDRLLDWNIDMLRELSVGQVERELAICRALGIGDGIVGCLAVLCIKCSDRGREGMTKRLIWLAEAMAIVESGGCSFGDARAIVAEVRRRLERELEEFDGWDDAEVDDG